MNERVEFWRNQNGWPRDTSNYVFLARCVRLLGESMFGDEWVGDEPTLALFPDLPGQPPRDGISGRASFAHHLLMEKRPDLGRGPVPVRKGVAGFRPLTTFNFTKEEWEAACELVREHNKHSIPGITRLLQVKEKIAGAAAAGELKTALRPMGGGLQMEIPAFWWNTERISQRFDLCQMNPKKPFGLGSAGDGYFWIYVSRQDIGAVSAAKSLPIRAKPKRRIAESKIEQEFRRWRDGQQAGYIPTEAEDIAHMKGCGVSRDRVRALRKTFGSRKRGEKRS